MRIDRAGGHIPFQEQSRLADWEDMATFAHSLGVEPEDMWSGNAQFGMRDICAALMERNAAQPEMVRLYIPCYKANR